MVSAASTKPVGLPHRTQVRRGQVTRGEVAGGVLRQDRVDRFERSITASAVQDASALASKRKIDPREKEFRSKVARLVKKKFGGDFDKAWAHYDRDKDGAINKKELYPFLKDAGIGNIFSRGFWVGGIMNKLDKNKDGKIQRRELVEPRS